MTDATTTATPEAGSGNAAPAQVPAATPATTATLLTGTPATTATATDTTAAVTPEAKAAADKAAADAAAAKTGAPEAYADFKFAEGIDVKPEQVTEFTSLAKSYNLTQEQAQGLIDYQTKLQAAASESMEAARIEMETGWRQAAETDKEFGGAKLPETTAMASLALQRFGSPELTKFLTKDTRLGDHPEVLKFFARVGKGLGEDKHIQGDVTATPKEKTLAERMYPNQT